MNEDQINRAKEVEPIQLLERISVPYKMAGNNATMICIKHEEYEGSMVLYPDHVYCFGCQYHQDTIGFTMDLLSISFKEAVELLNLIADGK